MPPLITMLCHYWQLDDRQARRWWQAVCRAKWQVVRDWRQSVMLFDQALVRPLAAPQAIDAVTRYLDLSSTPAQVVGVLEALVGEQALSRQDARAIEAKMLARVNRHGQWT